MSRRRPALGWYRHAIYAVGRAGIDGYITEGEGFSFFGGFGMWGGELALGFRY